MPCHAWAMANGMRVCNVCVVTGFRFTIQCTLLQGLLRGYDQTNNLVIEDCHERVFSATVRSSGS